MILGTNGFGRSILCEEVAGARGQKPVTISLPCTPIPGPAAPDRAKTIELASHVLGAFCSSGVLVPVKHWYRPGELGKP